MRFTDNRAISIFAAILMMVAAAAGQSKHCTPVGGAVMTNLGAVDQATTMGTATGDLKGAVGATVLSTEVVGNNLVFHVQHHWVTESGDTLTFDPAIATTTAVATNLFAVVTYPVHLSGGTGKFAHMTGDFTNIGEVDLSTGQIVLRYSGQICSHTD